MSQVTKYPRTYYSVEEADGKCEQCGDHNGTPIFYDATFKDGQIVRYCSVCLSEIMDNSDFNNEVIYMRKVFTLELNADELYFIHAAILEYMDSDFGEDKWKAKYSSMIMKKIKEKFPDIPENFDCYLEFIEQMDEFESILKKDRYTIKEAQ